MRTLLAQPPVSGISGWNVTTSVAAAAAGISLVTLIVTTWSTGRRERAKWAREALAEAFYAFIDESFRTRDQIQIVQNLLWHGDENDDLPKAYDSLREQRTSLRHAQTKIRLLAPASTASLAQDIRAHFKKFSAALRADMPRNEWDRWTAEISEKRNVLITSAKKSMSLPK